jgi:hypothetical protein
VDVGSQRPARVLAGWLDEATAEAYGLPAEAARRCREAVLARRSTDVLLEAERAPTSLSAISSALADVDPRFRDGESEVVVVDLAHLVATQPVVALDDDRVGSVPADADLDLLADVTLPVGPTVLPISGYDDRAQSWVVRSRGASLAVTGRYVGAGDAGDPGSQCFGFFVSAQPSRMSVGVFEGRVVLRDGHHRAVALLARGVRRAPVALDHTLDLPLTSANVSSDVIFGLTPPTLQDYLNDEVSLDAAVARTERVVVISASEIDLPA